VDTVVIVTAYNEGPRLGETIAALRAVFDDPRIVVADDHSTDDTPQIAEQAGVELVRAPRNIGKGGVATMAAERVLSLALTEDPPVFVLCDGDLADSAGELPALVAAVRSGECDLAVAVFATRVGGGFGFAVGYARRAIKRLTGLELQAPISGQRAMRAEVLPVVVPFAKRFGMEIGMTVDAHRAGFRPPSASPTSARPRALGPAHRRAAAPRASSGRTGAPPPLRRAEEDGGTRALVRERTGLVLDPYFSGTKIEWLLDNVDPARGRARRRARVRHRRQLAGLEPDRRPHARHRPSNASRTLLYDIHAAMGRRAAASCSACRARAARGACPSSGRFGGARRRCSACRPHRPVAGIAGDQQARCSARPASTRAWRRTPTAPAASCCCTPATQPRAAATRSAHDGRVGLGDGTVAYALEGAIFVTGAAVQWLRDGSGSSRRRRDGALAASRDPHDGVYFVPALTGLGSAALGPVRARDDRRPHARHGRAPPRAGDARGDRLPDGRRGARDGGLMQFQADVLGVPVVVPEVAETTALGAAMLAGVGAGAFSQDAVVRNWRERCRYEPAMGADERAALLSDWRRAVARAREWVVAE
jgi:glycerol kinase